VRTIKAPIFTSCFARIKRIPPELVPVSIARTTPRFAGKVRRYPALAPEPGMTAEEYVERLDELEPLRIHSELGPWPCACACPASVAIVASLQTGLRPVWALSAAKLASRAP
jgi:hypothetical protein